MAENDIDVRAISIAETADYGVLRMIVGNAEKATAILMQHGYLMSMTPVLVVAVPDQAGGVAPVLATLAAGNVDIEYMYSLFTYSEGKAYIVFRVAETDKFIELLKSQGITPVTKEELGIN